MAGLSVGKGFNGRITNSGKARFSGLGIKRGEEEGVWSGAAAEGVTVYGDEELCWWRASNYQHCQQEEVLSVGKRERVSEKEEE